MPTNAPVTNWIDRIQGAGAGQASAANRPTNSSTGVRFNGSAWYLTNQPTFLTLGATETTNKASLFLIIKPETGPSAWSAILQRVEAGALGVFAKSTDDLHLYGNNGNNSIRTFVSGEWLDVVITAVTNATVCYTNGVAQSTNTSGMGWNQGYFGADLSDGGLYKGYLLEVAWYYNNLDATAVGNLHKYATNKYGYTP